MPLVDGRGLLLGRLNLIDAVIGLLVILLIPVGYGAYVVFRVPSPTITAVEPATVPEGTPRVRVLGENLRPFLRVMIGTERGTFLLESPSAGVVELPTLPLGTYDLALYDVAQEVARRPSVLTIVPAALPPPDSAVTVTGAFSQLDEASAHVLRERLSASQGKPAAWGSVLGFEPPERVGPGYRVMAVLRVRCAMVGRTCWFGKQPIGPDQQITLPLSDILFDVGRAFPSRMTPIDILVRVVSRPEIVAALKRTQGEFTFPALAALWPSLLSIDAVDEIAPDGTMAERQAGPVTIAFVRVRIPAVEGSTGWRQVSDNQPLKVGAQYRFETSDYVVQGEILNLRVGSPPIILK